MNDTNNVKRLTVYLQVDILAELKSYCKKKGIPAGAAVRMWIIEKLEEERSR